MENSQRLFSAVLFVLAFVNFQFARAQFDETEPNNDFPTANTVIVNESATINGLLGSDGDHLDHFRIVVTEYNKKIKVRYNSTPGFNMLIGLYDSEFNGLAVMPSFVQSGSDSVSFECAVAGIYYVRIRDNVFNTTPLLYTIDVEIENPLSSVFLDEEFNDVKDSAQWINFELLPNSDNVSQSVVQGNLRYRGNPNNLDLNDWYKFVLNRPGALFIQLASTSNPDITVTPFLSSENGSVGQNLFLTQENFCLDPDTFYFRISAPSVGACFDYSFIFRHDAVFNSNQENEPNDDIANADFFQTNMFSRLGYNRYDENGNNILDDRDFFEFATQEDGELVISIEPDTVNDVSYSATLFSGVSNEPLPAVVTGNPAAGDTIQLRLSCAQADTFFLRLQNESGNCGLYRINVDVEAEGVGDGPIELEPNNIIEQAQDISALPEVFGSVGFKDYSNAPPTETDNVDFFRFTPSKEGDLRIVSTTPPFTLFPPVLTLTDTLGNLLAISDISDTLYLDCVGRIPYIVSVESPCVQYKLEWTVESDFETDEEPNDIFSQAIDFPINEEVSSVEGRIGAPQVSGDFDVTDYYKIIMSQAGNTKLWFTSENGDGTLSIWSNQGDLHSLHQAAPEDSVEIDLSCLAQDSFFISVGGGETCFGYRISGQVEGLSSEPDMEPNDDISNAIEVFGSSDQSGQLGGELISESSLGDIRDYYKLIVPFHGSLSIEVNTTFAESSPLVVQLLATNGSTVFESDTLWNQGSSQMMYECMQPDTLYLLVKPLLIGLECQGYDIQVDHLPSFPATLPDSEPNDDESSAILLFDNEEKEGLLGFFRYGIADLDAVDYYVFNAAAGFLGIEFSSLGILDSVQVNVFSDSQPNILQFDYDDLLMSGEFSGDLVAEFSEPIYVEVQNTEQCGPYTIRILQYTAVGVDNPTDSRIEVFPNPADGFVEVRGAPVSKLQLFDMRGRLLAQSSTSQILLDQFNPGVYLLMIKTKHSGTWIYKKIVKQ